MQFVQPIPFQDAIDLIGNKTPIGAALSSSEWSDVPVELRLRAMFSANVENVRFLQRAQDSLGDFLSANKIAAPDGSAMLATGGRAAFIQQLRQFALAEGMGPLEGESGEVGGLKDITSERRLGLIFDTLTRQAGDYGYWKQGMDVDVLNEFPAQRFIRVLDVKEPRTTHIQYENQVYLKTDPIWALRINQDFQVPWGPWAWGCGHDVEDVDRAEAVSLNLLAPNQRIQPVPHNFNQGLQASTRGLAPELLAKLKQVFGHSISIGQNSISWSSHAVQSPKANVQSQPKAIEPPAVPGTNQTPVSDAIEIKVRGGLKKQVQLALDAIDEVHDDGTLPVIPVTGRPAAGALGQFFPIRDASGFMKSQKIAVLSSGKWPALTTIHEVGHFLDLEAIGAPGGFASESSHPEMTAVMAAAEQTASIKGLQQLLKDAGSRYEQRRLEYFLRPREIWARAYAQFIAEESGNAALQANLQTILDESAMRQWTAQDFKPISDAIKTLFVKLNWL